MSSHIVYHSEKGNIRKFVEVSPARFQRNVRKGKPTPIKVGFRIEGGEHNGKDCRTLSEAYGVLGVVVKAPEKKTAPMSAYAENAKGYKHPGGSAKKVR